MIQEPEVEPVTRVVNLLKDLKSSLENEAEEDEAVYEKLACWCETNDKSKTLAISDADAKIKELDSTIQKTTALKETLGVEIPALVKEIAENKKSLAESTAIRGKQSADFTAEEKEMMESITALGAAVMVLSKHNTALISTAKSSAVAVDMKNAAAAAFKELQQHSKLLLGVVTPKQRKLIAAFARSEQVSSDYFDAAPTFNQAYAPQGGEIFGILRQMKETFESDLTEAQKEELAAQETFTSLKTAKEGEIATGEAALEDKQQQLAAAQEKLAQAKDERTDTDETMKADKDFLSDLKVKCALTDHEWEQRQQLRQDEIKAVQEALTVLTSDESRELFSRTFKQAASFMQKSSRRSSDSRTRAAKTLTAAAVRLGDPKLSALATSVQLDAFVQVKKAIDDMVAELLKEADDESKHRDFCIDEIAKNDRETPSDTHTKGKIEATIELLRCTSTI